ncbi:MAG: distal tail protein Dit [Butyricicoccus sp.]
MYQFRDTKAGFIEPDPIHDLPMEAFLFNDEYFEHRVRGYRTLYVRGRETIETELEYYESPLRDGATIQNKRYPTREITVGYQIVSRSAKEFREAYNTLLGLLDAQETRVIFRDEPDKYFTVTKTSLTDVEPGRNAVTGEITFFCADPFKYSVEEHSMLIPGDDVTFQYHGTSRAWPTLEADFAEDTFTDDDIVSESGDCGFVSFIGADGNAISLGSPEEVDGTEYAKSQTLINRTFESYNKSGNEVWKSGAATLQTYGSVSFGQKGTAKIARDGTKANNPMLTADDYGTGSDYNGLTVTRTIPAQASGATGSTNWTLSYKQRFAMDSGANNQRGLFEAALFSDGQSVPVAAVLIRKSASGTKGEVRMYINGSLKKTVEVSLYRNNTRFGFNTSRTPTLTTTISKDGSKISFNVAGIQFSARDSAIETAAVHKISFYFAKRSGYPSIGTNGLYWVKFRNDACETWADIPNKFSGGDIVEAVCGSGEILLNGIRTPELGSLTNNWEGFCLTPGSNTVGVQYSSWAKRPTFRIRYREVYL